MRRWTAVLVCALCLMVAAPAWAGPRCQACARDHHGRILRSGRARNLFKRLHPCPATGARRGPCPGYVIDHRQALKHGGADVPANMQWQTRAAARAKDRWE